MRLAAIMGLTRLFEEPANLNSLHDFVGRFERRCIELVEDIDEQVAVKAVCLQYTKIIPYYSMYNTPYRYFGASYYRKYYCGGSAGSTCMGYGYQYKDELYDSSKDSLYGILLLIDSR